MAFQFHVQLVKRLIRRPDFLYDQDERQLSAVFFCGQGRKHYSTEVRVIPKQRLHENVVLVSNPRFDLLDQTLIVNVSDDFVITLYLQLVH
jgi:hypothetical protein